MGQAPSELMRAAWWWIDRWRKSTAYTDMTLAEQGAYRNLLDELWLRDGVIPDDERILAKVCGDPFEWPNVREKVLARFVKCPEGWRNQTHDEVSKGTKDFRASQSEKGRKGAEKRWHGPVNSPAISPANGLPSPSPSPSPSQNTAARPQPLRPPAVDRPANPLVAGRRVDLEREFLSLVSEIAKLTDRDPLEVAREATGYEGARTTPINPASMSDDRLANSVMDLRSNAQSARAKAERSARGIREVER